MRSSFVTLALAVFAVKAHPSPSKRSGTIDDTTILNFALTLEHLENAFYKQALLDFDDRAFKDAGLPNWARARFAEIASHEEAHVKFLSTALGDKATQPCTYDFPYTDPASFVALSQVLEGVGVSAYTGAAHFIENRDYLTAAASVLATEARHASWVASAVNNHAGWSGELDVPLGLNSVYTLAASFIVSCPDTNPALPVNAFPALTFADDVTPGSLTTIEFEFSPPDSTALFVVFYSGLSKYIVPINDGTVDVPKDLKGTIYAVISTNDTDPSDDNTVAGPAILKFEFNSSGQLLH